jgi:serine phosphatase RsbU (regulator of sigma subunit)
MDQESLNRFRNTLNSHRNTLLEWLEEDTPEKQIRLNGKSDDEVMQILSELKEVLHQVEEGEFGACQKCEGEVETERLELDFTTSVCLAHYTEAQIRGLESDLELASKVQRELLPCCVPTLSGIEVAMYSEPARIVGGDYHDFFPLDNGAQGVVIADVMGKGLPASILMSNLQASLRIIGPQLKHPAYIVSKLNELFNRNLKLIKFISLFLANIDPEEKLFHYCNAGHHPPLLFNVHSQKMKWLQPTGPAIGLGTNSHYEAKSIALQPGDFILMYTDGLVEAQNASREEYGDSRLASSLFKNQKVTCNDLLKIIRNDAHTFAGQFQDDVTLLALKVS